MTPFDVAARDFNGDGKPGIATVGHGDRTYGVLLNTTVFAPPARTVATRRIFVTGKKWPRLYHIAVGRGSPPKGLPPHLYFDRAVQHTNAPWSRTLIIPADFPPGKMDPRSSRSPGRWQTRFST